MGVPLSKQDHWQFHGNWSTLQTNLRMQIVDSSIKICRPVTSAASAARLCVSCASNCPIMSSLGCPSLPPISAQSLEAMAVIMPESVGRISGCCMHFACNSHWRRGALCTPNCSRRPRIFDTTFLVCLAQLCTEGFPNRRPSQHTAPCGMI